ncbi:hypothetical protein [Paracoccus pacificus]|uniref:Uncharacterized protein n=1 Tax=Paracoccus pacificus TaxID=1463598 RepID=A0ABW4R7K6_9RHOB
MTQVNPQKKIDDRAFPIRMKLKVPANGFGPVSDEMYLWLDNFIGFTNYARHGGLGAQGNRTAVLYFRHPRDAVAFLDAFPGLELADRTDAGYWSPNVPFRWH